MQDEQLNRTTETVFATRKSSPFLQLAEVCERRRKLHIPVTLPRRQSCLKRAMIAALRAAEFADWQASGGDFLRSVGPNEIQS